MFELNLQQIFGRRLRKVPKVLINGALSQFGYEIRRKPIPKPIDAPAAKDDFDHVFDIIQNHTMVAEEALRSLYNQVRFCELNGITGDYVECGVWKGGCVGVMALGNLGHASCRRDIHLFDAFDDICEPDAAVDGARAVKEVQMWAKAGGTQGKLKPLRGFYEGQGGPGTVREAQALLEKKIGYSKAHLHYHRGWFQETLPTQSASIQKIAILRLDADWYASTKICLDYFYEKVVAGGFVIIDDYGAYDGCRKAVDEFISRIGKPIYLNEVNSETRYFTK